MGPNIHPALHKAMKELADKLEIPYALEYTPRHSGTDGMATQVSAEGIPTLVMGIPLRYMHTPVEVVADQRHPARRPVAGRVCRRAGAGFHGEDCLG